MKRTDNRIEGALEDLVPLMFMPQRLLQDKLRSLLSRKQRETLSRFWPVISKRRAQVLTVLAERGPLNMYRVQQTLGTGYSVVHSTCRALENAGFIKLLEEKLTGKSMIAKVYGLTLIGLCGVLVYRDAWTDEEGNIVGRWKNLDPLVLGKWSYLTSKLPREEVSKTLRSAMQCAYEWMVIDEKGKRVGEGPDVQAVFRKDFFYSGLFFLDHSTEKWAEAVNGDAEIKEWVRTWLREEMAKLQGDLSSIKEMLRKIGTKS